MLRQSPSATTDEGSAALEFITVGLLLLVPLVYVITALGGIQQSTLGAEVAARHTARVIALADDATDAGDRAELVLAGVIAEYGLDAQSTDVAVSCAPTGEECPTAGAILTVTVVTSVRLPLVPPVLGLDEAAAIPVEASAVQKISRLWGGG